MSFDVTGLSLYWHEMKSSPVKRLYSDPRSDAGGHLTALLVGTLPLISPQFSPSSHRNSVPHLTTTQPLISTHLLSAENGRSLASTPPRGCFRDVRYQGRRSGTPASAGLRRSISWAGVTALFVGRHRENGGTGGRQSPGRSPPTVRRPPPAVFAVRYHLLPPCRHPPSAVRSTYRHG